jgi:putative protease
MKRPEILAPAGDEESLAAAVRAGADAVYFGLAGFNARARAKNFDADALARGIDDAHARGVKAYVTLNTLVFDHELPSVEAAIRACAAAGVDAVIVQDLGVLALVRAIAPSLHVHASTQMTCTDASSAELARELGASRVILARELSVDEIAKIRAETSVELEVFVHGALCISYSGQCLTSEAIGGRSANRGACAQACRLPYELVVDGELRPLGERAFLLSPEDLESSALVPDLTRAGVASLKIEGRLKGPAYVAATTKLYREALDGLESGTAVATATRDAALVTFSRGSGPGFLAGLDHQRLVEARGCDHRGLEVGELVRTERRGGRCWLVLTLSRAIARGAGLLVEGGLGGRGEVGGRVWLVERDGLDVERAEPGTEVSVWLGPEQPELAAGERRRVFLTDDPAIDRAILAGIEREPHREPIDLVVSGALGGTLSIAAVSARGLRASVSTDGTLEPARAQALDEAMLREKLGGLGESPFVLRSLRAELPDSAAISPSILKRARRALVDALLASSKRTHETTPIRAADVARAALPPDRSAPPPGLFVLARTEPQARAALAAGAEGVYLDFLDLTGTGATLRALRDDGARFVGVAPPRIRKPGEEKIDRYLASLDPDAILVRGLGALHDGRSGRALRVGDFSLNVTNRITAAETMRRALDVWTPAFDLDATQLDALLASPFGAFAEVVVHHPMPLFHMEHCVIAALLSSGKDHRSCGRPCDRHQLSLRDRAGMDHPVEADVGCRNTVFHAAAQSAAGIVRSARAHGVGRFRIELVRETGADTTRIVEAYRALLEERTSPADVFRTLRADGGYGVVKGSLRVLP